MSWSAIALEAAKVFVDFVRAIAWPLMIVGIAYWFREQIKELLPRIRRAGPTGIEVDPAGQAGKQKAAEAETTVPGKLEEFPGIARTPAIQHVEQKLLTEVSKLEETQDKKIALLVRFLAQLQIEVAFERMHNVIFGSQILGLRRLNESGSATIDEAREFFNEHAAQPFPELYSDYSFEQWIGYLLAVGLIVQNGNTIQITDLGRDFLIYLTAHRLTEQKPY